MTIRYHLLNDESLIDLYAPSISPQEIVKVYGDDLDDLAKKIQDLWDSDTDWEDEGNSALDVAEWLIEEANEEIAYQSEWLDERR